MASSFELSRLPFLALQHLTQFLDARDLTNLSATCCEWRAALNSNIFWHTFAKGGDTLSNISCAVQPEFEISSNTELEPICEKRVDFLRKSRLVHVIREGKFLHNFVDLKRKKGQSPFNRCESPKQYTLLYSDTYLIVYEAYGEDHEILYLFNIEREPYYLTSFLIENSRELQGFTYCILVENKLVIKRTNFVDIYDIIFPEFRCPLLHSIYTGNYPTTSIYGHFVLSLNEQTKVIKIWDVHSGDLVKNILPKETGPCVYIMHSLTPVHLNSSDEFSITFRWEDQAYDSTAGLMYRYQIPIFGYDLDKLEFSSFNIIWQERDALCDIYTDGQYVVFIGERQQFQEDREWYFYLIIVYDYKTSTLLAERLAEEFDLNFTTNLKIIHNFLLISFYQRIQILDLNTLETMWEIPEHDWDDFAYWNIMDQCHLVVTEKYLSKKEVWDLETKAKVCELPVVEKGLYYFYVSNTKVVFRLESVSECNRWCVLHFW